MPTALPGTLPRLWLQTASPHTLQGRDFATVAAWVSEGSSCEGKGQESICTSPGFVYKRIKLAKAIGLKNNKNQTKPTKQTRTTTKEAKEKEKEGGKESQGQKDALT